MQRLILPPANLLKVGAVTIKETTSTTIESDNHANTWYFGPNFVIDRYTGQVCDVSGYDGQRRSEGVCVATGFTLWTDPNSGRQVLIQVNQGLDMTTIIDHTLANPNQCQSFGISWCDDPWDPHRDLGMILSKPALEIPFDMIGSTVSFTTRTPTEQEYKDLFKSRIVLTNEMTWDPNKLVKPSNKRKAVTVESVRTVNSSALHSLRLSVPTESLRVCEEMERDAGLIQGSGDARLLSDVSTAFTDETLLPRIVLNVHVASTTTSDRHCDISPETLSEKWRIGLETARETLRITTQQGI